MNKNTNRKEFNKWEVTVVPGKCFTLRISQLLLIQDFLGNRREVSLYSWSHMDSKKCITKVLELWDHRENYTGYFHS